MLNLRSFLQDPEPNVRAAVLKQLAEQPSPGMTAKIAEYVAGEQDADLVVHAVRVLRKARGPAAHACLKGLLKHASWRVRAEVAEGLVEVVNEHRYDGDRDAEKAALLADIYSLFIGLLDDPDGFVVSKALTGLQNASLEAQVEPLVRTAAKHPELTVEVVKALGNNSKLRSKTIPHVRNFCRHESADVRATAIATLSQAVGAQAEAELRTALQDADSRVRQAAAAACYQQLAMVRPAPQRSGREPVEDDEDLASWRSGKNRPEWLLKLAELHQAMLKAERAEERVAGGLTLMALARDDVALPVLLAAARSTGAVQGQVGKALFWLPWPQRHELFRQLLDLKPEPEQLNEILSAMRQARDRRAVAPLWELAARPLVTAESADALVHALLASHFGDQASHMHNGRYDLSAANRKLAVAEARPRAAKGPEIQRLIALCVLVTAARDDGLEVAGQMLEDATAPSALRRDAFQLGLLLRSSTERRKAAVEALGNAEPLVRQVALLYLATSDDYRLLRPREGQIYLRMEDDLYRNTPARDVGPDRLFVPDLPSGLKPELLRPLLRDPDPTIAACAGYLLALLRQPDGLPPLVRYWREEARADETWRKLVYRAVAVIGDEGYVPLLEEVYRSFGSDGRYQVREFYWTIRSLEGPRALRLRKQIRADVGMEHLR